VATGSFQAALFQDPGLLVVSPGISLKEPAIAEAIQRGVEAVGDVELFARAAKAPVVAITGSNGKSTVTSLAGEMCREAGFDTAVGGNIGVPVLDLLRMPEPEVYVLELSSFQLETASSLNARAATVLNITPDHMDRYAQLVDYAAAKARVFRGDGVMVLNADDPAVMAMGLSGRSSVRFGSSPPTSDIDYGLVSHGGETWLARGARQLMPASGVPVPGRHNLLNVLAAMALAEVVHVPLDAMKRAVARFQGLHHRTELVAERHGVRWIDDSKGTNVGATVAALGGMDAPVILIAGGDGKGADFSELRAPVAKHARAVVLIGRDAPQIEKALAGVVPVVNAADMPAAVRAAARLAQPGDVVLLSPACASFDMFRNYEHRGQVFAQAVKEVAA
jgi:UDP-N-acetylmuramoylalanine--D-glutamate ligase